MFVLGMVEIMMLAMKILSTFLNLTKINSIF